MNWRSKTVFRYYLGVGIFLILIFTVLKPAGTEGAAFFPRLLIWTMNISLLLFILIALHMLLQSVVVFDHLNPWFKLALSGMLGAVIFVPAGLGIDYLFQLDDWSDVTGLAEAVPFVYKELSGLLLPVTFTWIAINAPRVLQLDFKEINANRTPPDDGAPDETAHASAFLPLIHGEMGSDIIYLKSELHYVRVVTTAGEKLVLFNLKDAMADLETEYDGVQTHRSFWVTGRHVKEMVADKDRKYIRTTNGHRIPVSRRKAKKVRQFLREHPG